MWILFLLNIILASVTKEENKKDHINKNRKNDVNTNEKSHLRQRVFESNPVNNKQSDNRETSERELKNTSSGVFFRFPPNTSLTDKFLSYLLLFKRFCGLSWLLFQKTAETFWRKFNNYLNSQGNNSQ